MGSDLEAFRVELGAAVAAAGLSFESLARAAHEAGFSVSRSTLHNAANPRHPSLPSQTTIEAYVQLLDPDGTRQWRARWEGLCSQDPDLQRRRIPPCLSDDPAPSLPASPVHTEAGPTEVELPEPPPQPRRRLLRAAAVTGLLATGGVVGSLITLWLNPSAPASTPTPPAPLTVSAPSPLAQKAAPVVRTGDNPLGVCDKDAMVAATQTIVGRATLKLVYSPSCQAYWAKVQRDDSHTLGTSMSIQVIDRDDPTSTQVASERDVATGFTTLIRTSTTGRVCAQGSVTTNGRTESFPGPAC